MTLALPRSLWITVGFATVLVVIWSFTTSAVNQPELATADGEWSATYGEVGAQRDVLVTFASANPDEVLENGFDTISCEGGQCRAVAALSGEQTLRLVGDIDVTSIDVIRQIRSVPFDSSWITRLFVGLLAFVPIYWLLPGRAPREWLLIGFSVVGLALLQPVFTAILLGVLIAFHAIGVRYRRSENRSSAFILRWIAISALILLFLKNFKAIATLPFEEFGTLALVLPLGTSYFLIRVIDLQLRWHRGQLPDLNLRRYLYYLTFPPTLVAGPIEMVDSFDRNRVNRLASTDVTTGLGRIAIGLAKKLIIVDALLGGLLFGSGLWGQVTTDPSGDSWAVVRFLLLTYLFAYLDFSAYSDIAIGVARLFGHTIIENFNWPILAPDLAEFWRRWHISLSGWAFRNVFFPVMATSKSRTVALVGTLFLVGLWHDLTPSWVTWGLYHGIGLSVLAAWKTKLLRGTPKKVLGVIATNLYVAGGFAFVTIRDYGLAWRIFIEYILAPLALF